MEIESLIFDLSKDPFNPELNFKIAQQYEKIGQTASAISFYLRTAEYGYESSPSFVYCALLKAAQCFETQQHRQATVENLVFKAISYLPSRQEAFLMLSRLREQEKKWQESYSFAQIGLRQHNFPSLPADVGYTDYALTFQKAVAGWWVGRQQESIDLFKHLLTLDITDAYRQAIQRNLDTITPA